MPVTTATTVTAIGTYVYTVSQCQPPATSAIMTHMTHMVSHTSSAAHCEHNAVIMQCMFLMNFSIARTDAH